MTRQIAGISVDPSRNRLFTPSAERIVEPRVMDVLVCLMDHGQQVVSREVMTQAVWGDVHVGYHALARAVSELRRTLDELAPGTPIIETVPRRGYRLAAGPSGVSSPAGRSHLWRLQIAAAIVPFGLIMHAGGWHGSPLHLVGAALICATAIFIPAAGAFAKVRQGSL